MSQVSTITRVRRDEANVETLASLYEQLRAQQDTKLDYLVDTRMMTFSTEPGIDAGETSAISSLTFDADGGIVSGPINDHAHNQIAQRLAIPRKYYDRMRVEAPGLLDTNVGHWFVNAPETRMVRMLDGNVRALMSSRYKRRDNLDLVEQAILPAFGSRPDMFHFQVASLTPERLVIRALCPSVTREVEVGDVVQAGIQITNSEVGKSSLSVTPFVWRLRCLNGMVVNDRAMRAYHVGGVQESDEHGRIYQDDTMEADDRAFFLKARDAILAAVDDTVFGEVVELMRAATDGAMVQQPVAATQRLADSRGLGDAERDAILASLIGAGDLSWWGVVNAVTDAAKQATSFDRQVEMEALGYDLLRAPRAERNAVAFATA